MNLIAVPHVHCGEADKEKINADKDDQLSCVNKNVHDNYIKELEPFRVETGYPGTYDSVANAGKEDLTTVLDKDLSMCIMASEFLRTTTNVGEWVKPMIHNIYSKGEFVEHPWIEMLEKLPRATQLTCAIFVTSIT